MRNAELPSRDVDRARPKAAWQRPELTTHGTVEEITWGDKGSGYRGRGHKFGHFKPHGPHGPDFDIS